LTFDLDSHTSFRAPASHSLIRWTGLSALVLIELTFLAIWPGFHGSSAHYPRWVAFLIQQRSHALQLGVVIVTATALVGGRRLGDELLRLAEDAAPARWRPWLVAHLVAFALAAYILVCFFDEVHPLDAASGSLLAVTALAGLASLVFWSLAVLPAPLWARLGKNGSNSLLFGVMVGALAWTAGWLTDQLWRPLSQGTLWLVYGLLKLTGSEIICEPDKFLIATPSYEATIEPACSGYQGIGLIWAFILVFLWLFRHQLRFPHALLLLPIGTLVIWLANAIRIALLIVIGTWVSPDIAAGGFHSIAGWLAFNAIALGMIALTQRASFLLKMPLLERRNNPAAPYLVPILAVIATALVTGALSAGFDYLYPVRALVGAAALLYFWRSYARLEWSWSGWSVAVGATVFAFWVVLDLLSNPSPARETVTAQLANLSTALAGVWIGCRALGFIITAPLAEELAFRGYLTRRVIAADFETVPLGRFTLLSFLVSSAAFGAMHGRWFAGTLAGMFYALALYRRGQLSDCVVAHATTNTLLAFSVLLTGKWSLWS
jgi:exosortase E/protease (VPEID-CTERM system)